MRPTKQLVEKLNKHYIKSQYVFELLNVNNLNEIHVSRRDIEFNQDLSLVPDYYDIKSFVELTKELDIKLEELEDSLLGNTKTIKYVESLKKVLKKEAKHISVVDKQIVVDHPNIEQTLIFTPAFNVIKDAQTIIEHVRENKIANKASKPDAVSLAFDIVLFILSLATAIYFTWVLNIHPLLDSTNYSFIITPWFLVAISGLNIFIHPKHTTILDYVLYISLIFLLIVFSMFIFTEALNNGQGFLWVETNGVSGIHILINILLYIGILFLTIMSFAYKIFKKKA